MIAFSYNPFYPLLFILGKKAVDVFTTVLMDTAARAQKINMKFVLCCCDDINIVIIIVL